MTNLQRNTLDKPVEEWTPESGDGKPLTKKKNPELYHKYRLAALSRTAGRFELPDGTLDAVWQLIEPTITQMLSTSSPETYSVSVSNAVFSASKYPALRQYAQNGSTFSVTLLLKPRSDAFYSFDDHRVSLHVPQRTRFAVPNFVERSLQELKSSLAHELVHHQQEIMTEAMGLSKDTLVGGPGRKNRIELADEPTDFYGQNLPHVQRDVEFYPNLETNLQEFDQMVQYNLANNREFPLSKLISVYLLEELRISKTNYSRYKKYVREFVRAVQDRYDANGRPKVNTQPKAADLARTAGRFELPPGVLEHVWETVEETVEELAQRGAQGHRYFNFPMALFAKSKYESLRKYVQDEGGAFIVMVQRSPEGEQAGGYYNHRSQDIVINVREGEAEYAKSVVAHELLHLQQDLLSRANRLYSMSFGTPGKNKQPLPALKPDERLKNKPDVHGLYSVTVPQSLSWDPNYQKKEWRQDLPHADRGVEFYTNMESNLHRFDVFVKGTRSWMFKGEGTIKDYIKAFIDAGYLRDTGANKARREKYLREFIRAVTSRHMTEGFRTDYLAQKPEQKVLREQQLRVAYAEAVRTVDSRQVMQLLIDVFVRHREDVENYAEHHKMPELTQVKEFIKKIDPTWAAMHAENDYETYKKHVVKLPKPKVEGIDPEQLEPISVTDAITELQRRFREAETRESTIRE